MPLTEKILKVYAAGSVVYMMYKNKIERGKVVKYYFDSHQTYLTYRLVIDSEHCEIENYGFNLYDTPGQVLESLKNSIKE